jgi:hypothetical protein
VAVGLLVGDVAPGEATALARALVHEEARPERSFGQAGENAGRPIEGHARGGRHDESRGRLERLVAEIVLDGGRRGLISLAFGAFPGRAIFPTESPNSDDCQDHGRLQDPQPLSHPQIRLRTSSHTSPYLTPVFQHQSNIFGGVQLSPAAV